MDSLFTRRAFLNTASGLTAFSILQTAGLASPGSKLESGTFLGALSFAGESSQPFHKPMGEGLDGRLLTDLRTATEDNRIIANDRFFVRTRVPDQLEIDAPWTVSVGGLVDVPKTISVDELHVLAAPQGEVLLECSGNNRENRRFGLLSTAKWDGVPLSTLLKSMSLRRNATRVLIEGFDSHSKDVRGSVKGASWIFTLEQIESSGAFLATRMNGEPLPLDHGYPIRLVVPGWYGCCCIKWVNRIALVDESAKATSQMLEFATRTHQSGRHPLARDYRPATMDLAALPTRVEVWDVAGKTVHCVFGIAWGGKAVETDLVIRFNEDEEFAPVQNSMRRPHARTWGLWSHEWSPRTPGRHEISLKAADPSVQTRRLDISYYRRYVDVTRV